jgi:NAD(P)H dehydrogenase (quinone)
MLLVSGTDLEQRAEQHAAAIDAAIGAGVRHVIYTSCLAPEPPNPAAVAPSHFATERYVASAGVAFTILRNGLYSEYQAADALQAIATGRLVHNWGAGRIAHVSRADCAAAAAAVLVGQGHDGAVYDITGGELLGAADVARLYGALGGVEIEPFDVDDATFVAGLVADATADDHRQYGANLVASFGRAIREGFMASASPSVARLTGRRPRTLRETLAPLLRR